MEKIKVAPVMIHWEMASDFAKRLAKIRGFSDQVSEDYRAMAKAEPANLYQNISAILSPIEDFFTFTLNEASWVEKTREELDAISSIKNVEVDLNPPVQAPGGRA